MSSTKIASSYSAIRFGLSGLFEEIEGIDPEITPFIDTSETIRVMLADFFYTERLKVNQNTVYFDSRAVVFKLGVKRADVERENSALVLQAIADKFWNLSDYIYDNVLKASESYRHAPNECFYQYSPEDRAIVVYVPVLEGLVPPAAPLPAAAVIHGCFNTLPSFLRSVIKGLIGIQDLDNSSPKTNIAELK